MNTIITRFKESNQGTIGLLEAEGFNCFSIELPWRDNKRSISRIFPGDYLCLLRVSPKFGTTYHLQNVLNRGYILIHSGNVAGDISLGYKSHSNGCILLGKNIGELWGQTAVLQSKNTLNEFMRVMNYESFNLKITDEFGG